MDWPGWRIGFPQSGYDSPSLFFQESGQAFVDMNGSLMLGPDGDSVCFPVRFLVEQMPKHYKRLLEVGNRIIGYLCLVNLTPAPIFRSR